MLRPLTRHPHPGWRARVIGALVAAAVLAVTAPAIAQDPGLPSTTKVLSPATLRLLGSMSADGAVLTFGAPTSELLALRPGDVIVGGIGGAARHGLLRRVVAVSTVNGQVVVTTTGASLSDAVREGRVDTSLALTPDQVESVILAPGVTQVAPGPQALVALPEITLQFDGVPVYDRDSNPFTTDDQVRASGRVTLQLSADLAVDIGRRTADFDVRLTDSVDLTFSTQITAVDTASRRTIAHYAFNSWQIPGPFGIPIVITPVLSLEVGFNGRIYADVAAQTTANGYFESGFEYANGIFTPTGGASQTFGFGIPRFVETFSAKAFGGPRLALRFYGEYGPGVFAELDLYLRMTATLTLPMPARWWELYGGIDLVPGLTGIFGRDVVGTPINLHEELLAASDTLNPLDLDARCTDPPYFRLDKNAPLLWGGVDDPLDHDWASVTTPSLQTGTTKMLLALNIVGDAEVLPINYDLELQTGDCRPLALSRKDTTGAWGDERILVDVPAGTTFRTHVFGRTENDYLEQVPNQAPKANYQLGVSFGSQTESFKIISKAVHRAKPEADEPPNMLAVELTYQNLKPKEFRNITFQVRDIAPGYELLRTRANGRTDVYTDVTPDDPAVRGVGATISVPNMIFCYPPVTPPDPNAPRTYPSSLCTLQEYGNKNNSDVPDDQFDVRFRIAVPQGLDKQPFRFAVDIYAMETPPRPAEPPAEQ